MNMQPTAPCSDAEDDDADTRAAQRSAKAAEEAVQALPVIERAHVYPEIVAAGVIEGLLDQARENYAEGLDSYDKPMGSRGLVTIKLTNFGKTPALLKTLFAGVGIAPLGTKEGLLIPEGILGDKQSTTPIICTMAVGFTRRQAEHVGVATAHVCLDGEVTFEDIWGAEHVTEFYFVWDVALRNFVLKETRTATKPKL
jgi:hypothetical protein